MNYIRIDNGFSNGGMHTITSTANNGDKLYDSVYWQIYVTNMFNFDKYYNLYISNFY